MEIYRSGSKYYGKLVAGWGNKIYETDGKTLTRYVRNPDVKLRNQPILNMVIISDFTYANGEYTGGKLYNPVVARLIAVRWL